VFSNVIVDTTLSWSDGDKNKLAVWHVNSSVRGMVALWLVSWPPDGAVRVQAQASVIVLCS